ETTVVDGVAFTTTRSGEGFGGRVAENGDLLMVHYTGKLDDGTVFDSSLNARPGSRKPYGVPLMLKLGRGEVIKGWEIGLQGMQVGEQRTIVIPPELAYGDRDLGVIPPNSTLTFDVELVGLYREE
ncbi:MAG: FKBP-type peptidyl-prolyl cis-trans isomerase, partial [Planctomycetota bacterium]